MIMSIGIGRISDLLLVHAIYQYIYETLYWSQHDSSSADRQSKHLSAVNGYSS